MRKKIVSIIGTRPQIYKIDPTLKQVIVNTGQHFDPEMDELPMKEMKIRPKYHLGCTSNEFGKMTEKCREVLQKERPDVVLVYGDTYSTLAGAIAASLEGIPIGHVEAGLRSHDRTAPEETNRIVADVLATWKFTPTKTAMDNLLSEGLGNGAYFVGDPLFWSLNYFLPLKKTKDNRKYIFATIHRRENLNKDSLAEIFEGLGMTEMPVYLPLHPHTRRMVKKYRIKIPKNVEIVKPQSRLTTLTKIHNAKMVITDSGGVQREAFWLLKHCLVLRTSTEWTETVEKGWATLIPASATRIAEASKQEYKHFDAPDLLSMNTYKKIDHILNEK